MSSHRSVRDWLLLAALVAMWGSSFMFIKLGVATVPPLTLVAVRLILGAMILLIIMRLRGVQLPPFGRVWGVYILLAVLGNCIPFTLITWGQQRTDSALAGILMAVMPLATMVLAHFFVRGEHMTRHRMAGFLLGFVGIVVLLGPMTLAHTIGVASTLATLSQFAILFGALCYAANSVLTRILARGDDVLVASTAMLLVASAIALPVALIADRPWQIEPSAASLWAILWLGIGPTAIATVVYFKLIATAGPTFMSLVNYISPVVAVFLGVALLGETPRIEAYVALALILTGIAVSQRRVHART